MRQSIFTTRSIRVSGLPILLLFLVGYFSAGFTPFNWQLWSPKNFVNGAVGDSHELNFHSPGIAYTRHAPEWLVKVKETSLLRVTLEVKSDLKRQLGPARIFTNSLDPTLRNLTIGQHGSDLSVRLRNTATNLNGMPGYVVPGIFSTSGWHEVQLTIEPKSLKIRVDREDVLSVDLPENPLANWSHLYQVGLGNELLGDRAWLGAVRTAIVETVDERIDYLAPDALYIPQIITIPDAYRKLPRFQLFPSSLRQSPTNAGSRDLFLNLFGFIPLGFIIAKISNRKQSLVITTILCAAISFTIEFGQVLLPSRISSISDFVLNTLGGAIGAWFARRLFR